jgi:hypothetical protein
MFPQLSKSERLLNDLTLWKSKINNIQDPKVKAKGQRLLDEFVNQTRKIDAQHDITYSRSIKLDYLTENIASLQTARYNIQQFVKDIDN